MEDIDSVCLEMFSPWVPKLLIDIFILTQHHEGYDIIKHVNQDCLHRVNFDPQKYPVSNQFQGDEYDLLCKDLSTSAIKQGYQIVKNGFITICFLVADVYNTKEILIFVNQPLFVKKTYHYDARSTCGLIRRKMCRRTITQRAVQKKRKCSFFSVQYNDFFFLHKKNFNTWSNNFPSKTIE